jgi:hypothetical protein
MKKTDNWQQHIGSVWASVLTSHALDISATVIEIAPGFTEKIGCGLAKMQFRGILYVLEPNDMALEWVLQRYKALLPNARIIGVNKATQYACELLPRKVEAIVMNHVLDDMIFYEALTPEQQQSIFSQTRPGQACLEQVKRTWKQLLGNPEYLAKVKQQVLADLCNLIDHTNARIVGISQYKSWFMLQNELTEADSEGNDLLGKLVLQLGGTSAEDENVLSSFNQQPKDWLVIEKERIGISVNKITALQQADKM